MKKNQSNLALLNSIFCVSLVVSNILASKILCFAGGTFVIPAAVVAYPITFLMTDCISEIWGKEEANKTVRNGLFCQLMCLVLCAIAIKLPVAPFADNQLEFSMILGSTLRVTFASLVAYVCSQTWDVWVFHRIRNAYVEKHDNLTSGKWIWNNASTMTSQIIDTAIFITIAFYGTVPSIITMVISQYVVKFVLALLDTPVFYILTKNSEK